MENFKWKPKLQLDKIVEIFGGKLLECGFVFQQNFLIRSAELGPDCKASIGALINILQVYFWVFNETDYVNGSNQNPLITFISY